MDADLQLISDGEGLAVIESTTAVERFLTSEGLSSKKLPAPKLNKAIGTGGAGHLDRTIV